MPQRVREEASDGVHPISDGERWSVANRRRGLLIQKEMSLGLTPAEQEELDELQCELARRLDAIAPLPFDSLEAFESAASEILADDRRA